MLSVGVASVVAGKLGGLMSTFVSTRRFSGRRRSHISPEQCHPPSGGGYFGELAKIEDAIIGTKVVREGEQLIKRGQPFKSLFAVNAGSLKASSIDCSGNEICSAFHFPPDIFGFLGMARSVHPVSVTALETSEVCVISYARLKALMYESSQLSTAFYHLLSRLIVRQEDLIVLMSRGEALERVAAFLLYISDTKSYGSDEVDTFALTMNREDVASFLGLATATVSRCLGELERQGLITVHNRNISILDRVALSMGCRQYFTTVGGGFLKQSE